VNTTLPDLRTLSVAPVTALIATNMMQVAHIALGRVWNVVFPGGHPLEAYPGGHPLEESVQTFEACLSVA
jgi:hypothetical protein